MFKYIFYLSLFILILTSCQKDPDLIDIGNVKVLGCDGESVYVDVDALIYNPNSYDVKLSDIKLVFVIDDKSLGNGRVEPDIVLKKKDNVIVPVNGSINLKELSEILPSIVNTDSFAVMTNIAADFSSLKLPVERKIKTFLKTKELLNSIMTEENTGKGIEIKSVKSVSPGFGDIFVEFIAQFNNRMPVNYEIIDLKFAIFNDSNKSKVLGSSESASPVTVMSDSYTDIPFRVKVNNLNTAATMASKLFRFDNTIYIEGTAKVKLGKYTFEVPVKQNVRIASPF